LDLSDGSNAQVILEYLLKNPGIGYTPAELGEATGIPRGSVGPTLKRLEDAGLVRHKKPYWAAAEDGRLAAAAASVIGLEGVASRYSDDWYANNEGWADDLPDLSNEA
jgi:DNA-binding IclR family transcriptional regulator